MIFNSQEFIIFFPLVAALYFLFPIKYRWSILLIASFVFYMFWKPEYIIILLISSFTDYFAALFIFKYRNSSKKKFFLFVSIFINLLILVSFKYYNFISENLNWGLSYLDFQKQLPLLNVLLPVGISFYTFQAMSYTIDVYRRKVMPERNFLRFELYVLFFPQLVAGPIERTNALLPQVNTPHRFNAERLSTGLKLMALGFFMKIAIADNLALIVTEVFSKPNSYFGWDIILATFLFAIQIYCDFAGYTNIARGAAHILGIDLLKNFKQPYFAISIRDFWKRWHISLSTWFRDYLYLPLGGKRVIKWRWYYNLFITFIISGIWHGANWTFLIWGAIHGSVYLAETIFRSKIKKNVNITNKIDNSLIIKLARIFFTFIIVCFSWIFFRANNINEAFVLIDNMLQIKSILPHFSFDRKLLLIFFILISLLFIIDKIEYKTDLNKYLQTKNIIFRWTVYYIIIFSIIGFGNWELNEFIYFQF